MFSIVFLLVRIILFNPLVLDYSVINLIHIVALVVNVLNWLMSLISYVLFFFNSSDVFRINLLV